ncbi:TPA: hypothetical protein RQJ58_003388 [Vibrio vulnificus]|nr:hypothetical protein [Vibrio vulnificus]
MNDSGMLQAHSWREAIYLAREIRKQHSIDTGFIESCDTLVQANKHLNRYLSELEECEDKSQLIAEVRAKFKANDQISEDELRFLKKNPRACGFCITFLLFHPGSDSTTSFSNNENSRFSQKEKYNFSPVASSSYGRKARPTSNEFRDHPVPLRFFTRTDELRKFVDHNARFRYVMDTLHHSNVDLGGQRYLVNLIHDLWAQCSNQASENQKFIDWLDHKSEEQITTCIKYLKRNLDEFNLPWQPVMTIEKYQALVSYFDYHLLMKPAETMLVIQKMKASWNQTKFRNKNKGKRPYSVSMTDRTKERLTWLVKQDDSNISDVIKRLIDERYEKLQ